MSPATSSSFTVLDTRDIEAQIVAGTYESFDSSFSTPISAITHTPRTSLLLEQTAAIDPLDEFFGASRTSRSLHGTQDSRHDAFLLPVHHDDILPPYSESSELPAYSRFEEHPTLAMYLFKFGFLFPLFWVAGAFILLSPLLAPEDWETNKTEAERQALIQSLRRAEVRWAKRCLIAFSIFSLAATIAIVVAVLILKS
ncbi:uncharacterized protein FIBRA_06167 [Fibroporia radiculosa]|uniref:Uncharacterized protein n=1 Tax=Fibroporia radiculosa TaxID=599839 RepID=J4GSA2_9APHY|nr:uncharacterized protein FIBRA_06167 [Fibroporia radiculosa]CCM04010.1 predicted protein [Fibroporia radiculosa]